MITYVYKCHNCGLVFDRDFDSIKDTKRVTDCIQCAEKAEKIFTPTNFKIKGYCYENEYKGKDKQ